MADKITFELVSPDRLLLAVEADSVTVPGDEGDFGVLPGHAPVIAALRSGVIEVEGVDEADARIFVAGGFAEVAGDQMTVLAEDAVKVSDLDRGQLEQRIANAREDVEDAKDDRQRQFEEGKLVQLQDMLATLR